MKKRVKVSGWGNYPVIEAEIKVAGRSTDARACLLAFEPLIARGMGRSYGDSSLNKRILSTLRLNRLLSFDRERGIVECEAGASVEELLDIFVPRGWFPAVTPGTKFVTVGGAIASDVHGKNHHKEGTFTDHLLSFVIMLPTGEVMKCSKTENADVFRAVCGGMGLVGIILSAAFKLKKIESSYVRTLTRKAKDLDAIMDLFEEYERFTYSAAWIDCLARGKRLGRSVIMLGEHASADDVKDRGISGDRLFSRPASKIKTVPCNFPNFVLNKFTAKGFNSLYYRKYAEGAREGLVDYNSFFYPLDAVYHWNRIYGPRGFTQYQFVLPKEASRQGLHRILGEISEWGRGSFLAVLKLFGRDNGNLLSFPMEGYTLALDFPISPGLFGFLDELDRVVLDYGGRLYLSKDARMGGDMFLRSYPYAEEFIRYKHSVDRDNRLQSLQSKRLGI
jgi:decaprenylphospho-beta-D-ribofuranose 2-oxidase